MSESADALALARTRLTDGPNGTPACIPAARRFDPRRFWQFVIDDVRVGWIRHDDIALLTRWPTYFVLAPRDGVAEAGTVPASGAKKVPDAAVVDVSAAAGRVTLAATLADEAARTRALGEVIAALRDEGRITGWRDETFAIRNAFDDVPLAFIERAASRFFGTMTYAVHVNGVQGVQADGAATAMWIARRSLAKAVDPGMLDNLVGGGIPWGCSVAEALVKECWEESGIVAELAATAHAGGTLHVLTEIEQGVQAEQLFVFDLVLPDDFVPRAEDGEVGEHLHVTPAEVLRAIAAGEMTMDASIATLECALRRGWITAQHVEGFAALYRAP
jgi:8-oxo-dGTP pyrophosphatase MutT (NUDIX family)